MAKRNLHRQRNYWEFTYSPESDPLINKFDWKMLNNNNGPNNLICCNFKSGLFDNRISDKLFSVCDFVGDFYFDKTFTFVDCIFKKCHFGWSNWRNVKFRNCKFIDSAFGITVFEKCQFLNCEYENITVSANETKFVECNIVPHKFLSGIGTNLQYEDAIKQAGNTIDYQKNRLSQSKSKIAKNIYLSLKGLGEENLFIESIGCFNKSYLTYKISDAKYSLKTEKLYKKLFYIFILFLRWIEYCFVLSFGILNNWGYSIGRVFMFGISVLLIFSICYNMCFSEDFISAFIKSFDITLVAGYTKHYDKSMDKNLEIIQLINLIFGIFWYSLFFPTILARTTKNYE